MKADGPAGKEVGVGAVEGDLGREGGKKGWVGATSEDRFRKINKEKSRE